MEKIGSAEAVLPLADAMKDSRLSKIAARALIKTGDPAAVQLLADFLKNNMDYHIRCCAAEALGEIGDSGAVWPLVSALRDRSESVRRVAAESLGSIGSPNAVQSLIRALKDKDEYVRSNTAKTLKKAADPDIVRVLLKGLSDADPFFRDGAAEALGEIGDPVAAEPLINALKDKNESVRRSAAGALGKIGDPCTVQPLIHALQDAEHYVRSSAAEALGKIGAPDSAEPLIAALGDKYTSVCRKAVQALEELCDTVALPGLADIMDISGYINKKSHEMRKSGGYDTGTEYGILQAEAQSFCKDVAGAVDKIVLKNKVFTKLHPDLLCSKCFSRTRIFELTLGLLKNETYVACRHCKSCFHLIKNVSKGKVTGVIGSNIENYSVTGDKVYINLWSEQQKKARNADIDVLEIENSGEISYDYAINAVLITLKNDVSRPAGYIRGISVVIHEKLPAGTMRMLEHEFGEIQTFR